MLASRGVNGRLRFDMNSSGLKCVLFDYGDVLSRQAAPLCIEEMVTLSDLSKETFLEAYFRERHEYDQYLIDGPEYWKRVLDGSEVDLNDETIDRLVELDVEAWYEVDPEMVEFAFALKEQGYAIGILSNMPIDHTVAFRERHKWMRHFDHLFFSAEFKLIKPSSAIYEYVLNRLDHKPEEILFVDDKEVNITGAREAGMKGFHYTRERTVTDLKEYFGLGAE